MLQRLRSPRGVALIIGIILGIDFIDLFLYPVLPQPLRAAILGLDQTRPTYISGFIGISTPYCGGVQPSEEDLRLLANNPSPLPGQKMFLRRGGLNSFSPIIAVFASDQTGNFTIQLPPGDYCFLSQSYLPLGRCVPYRLVKDKNIYDAPIQIYGLKVEADRITGVTLLFSQGCPDPPRP